jgi:uncharacterized caspase-like protein
MDQKLTALGFKVKRIEDFKIQQIEGVIKDFSSTVQPGDDVVVYYSGHGVLSRGMNYLIAVNAEIQSESDLPTNSLNLSKLIDSLADAKPHSKLLFVDAGLDNPFAENSEGADSGEPKIRQVSADTSIQFATSPGYVATDGAGPNGLYTTALLRELGTPNQPLQDVLKRVELSVRTASKGAQIPWTQIEGSVTALFQFNPTR